MPRFPDANLDCCIFLYPSRDSAEEGQAIGGSGFLTAISLKDDGKPPFFYWAVTNRHVAKSNPVIRVNTPKGPPNVIDLAPTDWYWPTEPGNDFAVAPIDIVQGIQYSGEPLERFVDDAVIAEYSLGIGDEVLSIGRFIDAGGAKNYPITRFGNVAYMPEIPFQDEDGEIHPSYLVEMRSRSGYSGSLIMIYIEPRMVEWVDRSKAPKGLSKYRPWVLGIQWAQIRVADRDKEGRPIKKSFDDYGTGMTAVVPAWKIKNFFVSDPRVKKSIEAQREMHAAIHKAVPNVRS